MGAALAVAAFAAFGAVAVEPGAASHGSGATCEYVELGRPGADDNELRIHRNGGSTLIGRSGERIVVDSVSCTGRTPTVTNIDRIVILTQSTRGLRLDFKSGPLGPGASESGPGAEIEIILPLLPEEPTSARLTMTTGNGVNRMTFGRSGDDEVVNLNPKREGRKDVDIIFEEVPENSASATVYTRGGDDTIDARGTGIGGPSAMYLHVHTGNGDDRILGGLGYVYAHAEQKNGSDEYVAGARGSFLAPGAGPDVLRGGPGVDRLRPAGGRDDVRAGRGNDDIDSADDKVDEVRCGPGTDSVEADAEDILRDCESVSRG